MKQECRSILGKKKTFKLLYYKQIKPYFCIQSLYNTDCCVNIIKLIHYENFNYKDKCHYSASMLIQFSFNVAKFINSETNSIQAINHLLLSWFIKRLFSQTYRRGFSFKKQKEIEIDFLLSFAPWSTPDEAAKMFQ